MKILNILFIFLVAAGAFAAGVYSPFGKKQAQATVATSAPPVSTVSAAPVAQTAPKVVSENKLVNDENGFSIQLKTNNWGSGNPPDILKILNSAKDMLDGAFQSGAKNDIWVYQNQARGYPITLYEKGPNGQYKIEISSTDRYWSNYAYQFSHEYCHVRTNYETPTTKAMWFDEVIGEMCSLYAIRRMSETWKIKPPYENWRSYSSSLWQYTDDIINKKEHQLPGGLNFSEWFKTNLAELEKNPQLRTKNAIIAIQLLPLFEQYPTLWNSLSYWNKWERETDDNIWMSFDKWLQLLPQENKSSTTKLIGIFES